MYRRVFWAVSAIQEGDHSKRPGPPERKHGAAWWQYGRTGLRALPPPPSAGSDCPETPIQAGKGQVGTSVQGLDCTAIPKRLSCSLSVGGWGASGEPATCNWKHDQNGVFGL